jgi:hypothetical protein
MPAEIMKPEVKREQKRKKKEERKPSQPWESSS